MNRVYHSVLFILVVFTATGVLAGDLPSMSDIRFGRIHGAPTVANKSVGDSVQIMGPHKSNATWTYFGDFQNFDGTPDWNDWTTHDLTDQGLTRKWSASTYSAVNLNGHGSGNHAAWCGLDFEPCSATDVPGGYGDQWYSWIEYDRAVPDTTVQTSVELNFWANWDLETDGISNHDVMLVVQWYPDPAGDGHVLAELGGKAENQHVVLSMTYNAEQYAAGPDGNRDRVRLWILVDSDTWTSDENCDGAVWQGGNGACQIDDLTVTLTDGASAAVVDTHDFEDGTLGNWIEGYQSDAVGDFANLASGLNDLDECDFNVTPQVNFVDQGFYIDQGLYPQTGITWTYGPDGYIVQNQGGLTFDPNEGLYNVVRSPIMAWPAQDKGGALLNLDLYIHEEWNSTSAGLFSQIEIRSTASSDPADIENAGFESDGYLYYGGPFYLRSEWDATEKLVSDRRWVQIQLGCWEMSYGWGSGGLDGTPAPYFDNVAFWCYPVGGPSMSVRGINLAQDNFPDSGHLDTVDLGNNDVRFDVALNISPHASRNDPGDSLVVTIVPSRSGSSMARAPRMYFSLRANPPFNPYRTNQPAQNWVEGESVGENLYAFDLPDDDFLYPGDRLHYYFQAIDDLDGDQRTSLLPADTSGFYDFSRPRRYDGDFAFSALPTLRGDGIGGYTQPNVLFWNDSGSHQYKNRWYTALNNLGLHEGSQYDTYYTQGASSGVGNGLGGRGTLETIQGYGTLFYSSGTLATRTVSNGDQDPGDDVGLLTAWFESGSKDALFTGNGLVHDLATAGGLDGFLDRFIGVGYQDDNLRPLIANQASPLVRTIPTNPVFSNVDRWIAFGGCPIKGTFDAVFPADGAVRLAEFTDPAGGTGGYDYAAATLFTDPVVLSRVISMPYDFEFIRTDPNEPDSKSQASLAARTRVLGSIFSYFGHMWGPDTTNAPEPSQMISEVYPNPFNPICRVAYTLPQSGHLDLKIYNLRGELVAVLVDEFVPAGPGFAIWDGTNGAGADQASGLYFYEIRTETEARVGKMSLVR